MKILVYALLVFACIFAGLSSRNANIEKRVPHADEAEQASTFLKLRSDGVYNYNPNGPHGATLYYWANLFDFPQNEITIQDLRKTLAPAALLVLLALVMSGMYVGRGAAWAAVSCFSLSALAQIYSGYFVHEIIFAFAVFATALAAWRFACAPKISTALVAGLFAGLAQSTKETAVISFAAMLASFAVAAAFEKNIFENLKYALSPKRIFKFAGAFLIGAAVVFVALYSSFGTNWKGIADAFASYSHFLGKAGAAEHAGGALFYLKLLFLQKSEGAFFGELPISILAIFGFAAAVITQKKTPWKSTFTIFAFSNAFFAILALSCITYKTPWLLLSPMTFLCLAAGFGIRTLLAQKNPAFFVAALALVCALGYFQYRLSSNASVRYDSDPRNPFIYAHTVRDFDNLIKRVEQAAKYSEYGSDIPVAFAMKESPWPAPFLLRRYRNAGYWSGGETPADPNIFDVVICDDALEPKISKLLDTSKYNREFFGLRKNLVLSVFVKKEIFDKITSN